ncbi:MAG: 2Fe-2S iron-sulfur cluster-binding protein, partial [Hyphomicrobiales bacterium]|nr:2Fe-2S iron-sulfur cluster-binding protein [Hyphomicrobiales bacterium]
MSDGVTLTITADEKNPRVVHAKRGETMLDVAHRAGVEITATCGKRGRCRSCRCKVVEGTLPPPSVADNVQLGHEEVRERFRLACQTNLVDDTVISPAPPKTESGYQILGGQGETTAMALDSGVLKRQIKVSAPESEHHQTSDLEEIFTALGDALVSRDVPLDLIRDLPEKFRKAKGDLTATLFRGRLVDIENGDTTDKAYGMAFDIGTTSIVGSLLDLATGEELAAVGMVNPQAPFGADLMSRIAYAQ